MITSWGSVAGLPHTTGQILGLIFASPSPLAFADVQHELNISKGSTSHGLRLLLSIGAVQRVSIPGDRRDRFVPELSLRKIIAGLANGPLKERLTQSNTQLELLTAWLRQAEVKDRIIAGRVRQLQRWHKRSAALLPLAMRLFG